jgi:hypothetical protein
MVNSTLHQLLPHHKTHPQNHLRMGQLTPQSLVNPLQPRHRYRGALSGASRDDIFVRFAILPDASPWVPYKLPINRVYPRHIHQYSTSLSATLDMACSSSRDIAPQIHTLGFKRLSRVPCFRCCKGVERLASALKAGLRIDLAARLPSLCYVSLFIHDGCGIIWRGVIGVAFEGPKWDSCVYTMLSLLKGSLWRTHGGVPGRATLLVVRT